MMYLGTINLYYYIYAGFWGFLAKLRLAQPIQRRIEPKLIMEELARKKEMDMKLAKTSGKV